MNAQTSAGYELLLDIVKHRTSIRKLKPDPIPDDYIQKILEVGHWAMSGANSQPWEYIVVKDPQVKKDLFRAYTEVNAEFIYWMEQQRVFELRHPVYQMTADEAVERQRRGTGWSEAPALIVVLGDGRRQWGTVQGAYLRAGAVASHRRFGQHLHVDAPGGIAGSGHPVGEHSRPRAF